MKYITTIMHHSRLPEELHDDVEVSLTCNTEKDRHIHLNERTAGMTLIKLLCVHLHFIYVCCVGILAIMWPCGVITMLCELFISESKSHLSNNIFHCVTTAI